MEPRVWLATCLALFPENLGMEVLLRVPLAFKRHRVFWVWDKRPTHPSLRGAPGASSQEDVLEAAPHRAPGPEVLGAFQDSSQGTCAHVTSVVVLTSSLIGGKQGPISVFPHGGWTCHVPGLFVGNLRSEFPVITQTLVVGVRCDTLAILFSDCIISFLTTAYKCILLVCHLHLEPRA